MVSKWFVPILLFFLALLCDGTGLLAADFLTEVDAGHMRGVLQGDKVILDLPENPSTGYRWTLAIVPANAADITRDRFIAGERGSNGRPSRVGMEGTRRFSLRIHHRGRIRLDARLWRHWEGAGSVKRHLRFSLWSR
ncbi:protease inhibitor I42 family protein [Beijerinckia mobilis]|uniref:protease inhibitor I42 family protein n=1 Tax=Beijerinckia mobilis TaxID=231434 RepID=UPI00055869A8|nr:protease inhibitor I42 family protein [Beijerinckia mobilis]